MTRQAVTRRRPRPFEKLSGAEKLRRLQRSFPADATAVVGLMDWVWRKRIEEIRKGGAR
jgi:hypothetical protein